MGVAVNYNHYFPRDQYLISQQLNSLRAEWLYKNVENIFALCNI